MCGAGKHRKTGEISQRSSWAKAKMSSACRWAQIKEHPKLGWQVMDGRGRSSTTTPESRDGKNSDFDRSMRRSWIFFKTKLDQSRDQRKNVHICHCLLPKFCQLFDFSNFLLLSLWISLHHSRLKSKMCSLKKIKKSSPELQKSLSNVCNTWTVYWDPPLFFFTPCLNVLSFFFIMHILIDCGWEEVITAVQCMVLFQSGIFHFFFFFLKSVRMETERTILWKFVNLKQILS